MRGVTIRIAVVLLCLVLFMPLVAARAQQDDKDLPDSTAKFRRDGTGYCFQPRLVFGSIVIAGGRCYNFYLVRTHKGVFLGFGPSGQPLIQPGQILLLGAPGGARVLGALLYQVPLAGFVTQMPANSIQFLTVQAGIQGNRILIAVPRRGDTPHQVLFELR